MNVPPHQSKDQANQHSLRPCAVCDQEKYTTTPRTWNALFVGKKDQHFGRASVHQGVCASPATPIHYMILEDVQRAGDPTWT